MSKSCALAQSGEKSRVSRKRLRVFMLFDLIEGCILREWTRTLKYRRGRPAISHPTRGTISPTLALRDIEVWPACYRPMRQTMFAVLANSHWVASVTMFNAPSRGLTTTAATMIKRAPACVPITRSIH